MLWGKLWQKLAPVFVQWVPSCFKSLGPFERCDSCFKTGGLLQRPENNLYLFDLMWKPKTQHSLASVLMLSLKRYEALNLYLLILLLLHIDGSPNQKPVWVVLQCSQKSWLGPKLFLLQNDQKCHIRWSSLLATTSGRINSIYSPAIETLLAHPLVGIYNNVSSCKLCVIPIMYFL